jgi:4'-phosphopantetheinyl transferase EntD
MTKWIISETLRDPQDPDWEKLAVSFFPDGVHPNRKEGFLLSRSSLRDCLSLVEVNCPIPSLHLINHSHLRDWPQYTISLSHTNKCGAAMIAERKFFRTIGIDVEHEERIVNESILERIGQSKDLNLRNIELWCLKEAVFKTLMNTGEFDRPVDFSSICIEKNLWSHPPSNLSGKWELDLIKPYIVARSFLEN